MIAAQMTLQRTRYLDNVIFLVIKRVVAVNKKGEIFISPFFMGG